MSRIACPDVCDWQALLEGDRSEDQIDGLAHHLETCSDCRQTLESLAAAPAVWEDTARDLSGSQPKTGQEPALRHVVERLKEEDLATGEQDLSFLQPADAPELLGLLGPYQVREVIGRGGMGVVLKAFDATLHRLVAIKVLDPSLASNAIARRRFTRETQAAAAVCHDHVVAVHGVSESGGLPYLVMQYVAGESLQERLNRMGPLEVTDTVRIGLQTASGLAAAHAQGLIHRDIKPANLLLENGLARVKITDFGLARMADDVGLTQSGVVAGTPEYMAPEQARGEVVDHRADLFSLGSVLYACCTGGPPFRGSTALAVLSQVSEKEPVPIRSLNPDVPEWLESFIARLMAKDPAQRFQSASEVAALLESYLAHLCQPATAALPQLAPFPFSIPGQGDTEMAFPCAGCGTNLKAKPELVGKKVKCPRCGQLAQVPESKPPVLKETKSSAIQKDRGQVGSVEAKSPVSQAARSSTAIGWLAASLGLVLVLFGVWLCWPRKSEPSSVPDLNIRVGLDVTVGNKFIPEVEESGFYQDEENERGPFRWTDGRGRLVIPFDKREPPRALFVKLDRPKNSWLQIKVNDRELVNEKGIEQDMVPWDRTLDLSGIDLGEELVVEILSNTFVPQFTLPGMPDDHRTLGVMVWAVKMLPKAGTEETLPAEKSFLEVVLGHRALPGVEDSGFSYNEGYRGRPFRWTNGNGKLMVPLSKKDLPQALYVLLKRPGNSWLKIRVNDRELVNEKPGDQETLWERTLDLSGMDLRDKLFVEILSNTFAPEFTLPGKPKDTRSLGVAVWEIKMLRQRPERPVTDKIKDQLKAFFTDKVKAK